jgi:tRNA 2-thiouridine synthesizing protein A
VNEPAGAPERKPPGTAPPRAGDVAAPERDDTAASAITVLDCRGQRCPLPVIALARRLPELPVGGVLRVLADDPAAATDIPAWCRMRRQEYLGRSDDGGVGFDVRRLS